MVYKSVVIDNESKVKKLALTIENCANEMSLEGWNLVDFSVTSSNKAILLFAGEVKECDIETGEIDNYPASEAN